MHFSACVGTTLGRVAEMRRPACFTLRVAPDFASVAAVAANAATAAKARPLREYARLAHDRVYSHMIDRIVLRAPLRSTALKPFGRKQRKRAEPAKAAKRWDFAAMGSVPKWLSIPI